MTETIKRSDAEILVEIRSLHEKKKQMHELYLQKQSEWEEFQREDAKEYGSVRLKIHALKAELLGIEE